jgi:hypothetical protein
VTREDLGRLVRHVWVEWAREQDNPKPSWLLSWEDLDDGQREVDMRIGEALVKAAREGSGREVLVTPHELLRAAEGHAMTVSTTDGEHLVLRIPTLEEFKRGIDKARASLEAKGLHTPEPPPDDRLADIVRPLRIGGGR